MNTVPLAGLLALTLTVGAAPAGAAQLEFLGLRVEVPASWQAQPPASTMRLAQFRVPGEEEQAGAEFVVFYFGPGQGGGPEANIARWQSQFSSTDGAPVRARVSRLQVADMPVTLAELSGDYARGVGVGPVGEARPQQTLLAAIVETARGNAYLQLHGPSATVAIHREAFLDFVRGLRPQ